MFPLPEPRRSRELQVGPRAATGPETFDRSPVEIAQSHLRRLHLEVSAINVKQQGRHGFANGSLTSADPLARRAACEMIKAARHYARAVGADKVTCCPLYKEANQ